MQETEVKHQTIDDEEIFKQINQTYHSGQYMDMQETSRDLDISSISSNEEESEESLIEANADQDALLQSLEEALHRLENWTPPEQTIIWSLITIYVQLHNHVHDYLVNAM